MKQQDLQQTHQTRAQLAAELGVSKRALDKWLVTDIHRFFEAHVQAREVQEARKMLGLNGS